MMDKIDPAVLAAFEVLSDQILRTDQVGPRIEWTASLSGIGWDPQIQQAGVVNQDL